MARQSTTGTKARAPVPMLMIESGGTKGPRTDGVGAHLHEQQLGRKSQKGNSGPYSIGRQNPMGGRKCMSSEASAQAPKGPNRKGDKLKTKHITHREV